MSTVKQCDRCKAIYQNNTEYKIAGRKYMDEVEGIRIELGGLKGRASGKKYDLCDDCIKELSEWLEENRDGRKR